VTRTRIKICGITRPEDALAAAEAGADAIGIVQYERAKRYVPPDRAADILSVLPAFVTPVLLFVDAPADQVRQVAERLHVRHVQLHGQETADDVAALRDFTIVKALRTDRFTLPAQISSWKQSVQRLGLTHLAGFVLETSNTALPGGTGVENDWDAVKELQQSGVLTQPPALITAGGLRPDNVAAVVRSIRPYAVDVSSGVEETYGKKSADKIGAFIAAVREADSLNGSEV
jgi:phosphoribosylanthranilate isomerase